MKKIISIIVAILVIAVLVYLFIIKSPTTETTQVQTIDTTTSISGAVDKSNPFDVKVDPYQGYKNPFGNN